MTDLPGNPDKGSKTPSGGTVGSAGRRRLLQAGIASAPVVMTVLSRPVLATDICQAPSGYTSGNVSNTGMGPGCLGRSASYWQGQTAWPAPYYPKTAGGDGKKKGKDKGGDGTVATAFKDVFVPDLRSPNDNKTFLEVLGNTSSGQPYVARLCVATVLNIAAGYVPSTVMTKTTVQHLWNEYASTTKFHPTAAIVWDEAAIIAYLLTLMPMP